MDVFSFACPCQSLPGMAANCSQFIGRAREAIRDMAHNNWSLQPDVLCISIWVALAGTGCLKRRVSKLYTGRPWRGVQLKQGLHALEWDAATLRRVPREGIPWQGS